jgi:hypothetical protein
MDSLISLKYAGRQKLMHILHFKPPLLCDFPRIRQFASYLSQLEVEEYCGHAVVILWWRMVRWLTQ